MVNLLPRPTGPIIDPLFYWSNIEKPQTMVYEIRVRVERPTLRLKKLELKTFRPNSNHCSESHKWDWQTEPNFSEKKPFLEEYQKRKKTGSKSLS